MVYKFVDPCRGEYLWYKENSNFQRRKKMRQNGVRSDVRFPTGASGMKKGGSAKKKKQGYKDRKDESIAMRVKKKRSAKQLKASADDSYGKFGSKAKKSGKINK